MTYDPRNWSWLDEPRHTPLRFRRQFGRRRAHTKSLLRRQARQVNDTRRPMWRAMQPRAMAARFGW